MSQTVNHRIDSHKLVYHPHRVAQWLDGKTIYPLYMEISPAGCCNHRCTFCAIDYTGYQSRFLKTDTLLKFLSESAALGVKSVMYAGEGEPLLHPDVASIIRHSERAGMDVAITTNGVVLEPHLAQQILPYSSWIKISIDAGSPESYAAIHRTKPDDFHKVFANIEAAAGLVRDNGWRCTLGTQALLLPENVAELDILAALSKEAGARYLVIKPYSHNNKSHTVAYAEIDYSIYLDVQERLERFNDDNFTVIFRSNALNRSQKAERGYQRCLALPFWSYLDSSGGVWGCSAHMGDDRFLYGNINEESFENIWNGRRRRRSLDFVAQQWDPDNCRLNCRMDEINRYLWELAHPTGHVNFI
jgi:radical SAM protein with 4Fe4S-binding SPASM domain